MEMSPFSQFSPVRKRGPNVVLYEYFFQLRFTIFYFFDSSRWDDWLNYDEKQNKNYKI